MSNLEVGTIVTRGVVTMNKKGRLTVHRVGNCPKVESVAWPIPKGVPIVRGIHAFARRFCPHCFSPEDVEALGYPDIAAEMRVRSLQGVPARIANRAFKARAKARSRVLGAGGTVERADAAAREAEAEVRAHYAQSAGAAA